MNRTGAKILLVDDEVGIRNVYQIYLESKGYAVVAAATIAEAMRQMRIQHFDLALIDIFLGEENGLELLKGIIASGVALPVIVISGRGYETTLFSDAMRAGAAGVFMKTQGLTDLLSEIRRVLEGPRGPTLEALTGKRTAEKSDSAGA